MVWETTCSFGMDLFVVPTPFFWSSKTAILDFNEDDVNQCDNLAFKNDIRTPRSTLLDELHLKRGTNGKTARR